MFATEIRQKQVQRKKAFTHWKWHLDEVWVTLRVALRQVETGWR